MIFFVPAKLAFGIYAHKGIKTARAKITKPPVTIPPIGLRTPEAQFTAVLEKIICKQKNFVKLNFNFFFNIFYLENDPVVGIEETKDPIRLQIPNAIISWLASTGFPAAEIL